MKGKIKKVVSDRGFGFIAAENGKEIFFHRSALPPGGYEALHEGTQVEFQVEEGNRGPRAVNMKVIGE
jgi:CspA family cold shock protein